MQLSMTPWYLFDSSIREAGYIDVALGHLLLEATNKGFSEEKALLNYWDKSWIRGFGNAYSIRVMAKLGGVTNQVEPPKKPEGMRKDRTALGRLGLMMRPNGIQLDGLTWWIA